MERNTITELLGKTLYSVENVGNEELVFTAVTGEKYRMFHDQDCCEGVSIEDISGDLGDLVGSPITLAEEVVNDNTGDPDDIKLKDGYADRVKWRDSFTWTFYRFATAQGLVVIRWYGESNGYYSESVSFEQIAG